MRGDVLVDLLITNSYLFQLLHPISTAHDIRHYDCYDCDMYCATNCDEVNRDANHGLNDANHGLNGLSGLNDSSFSWWSDDLLGKSVKFWIDDFQSHNISRDQIHKQFTSSLQAAKSFSSF